MSRDEGIRAETTAEGLAKLKPAFREGGTVTAGNASTLSDGGAAVVVASARAADRLGSKPMARVVAYSTSGVAPKDIFIAPVLAVRQVLEKARLRLEDIDLFELNEAFAAQMLACGKELKLDETKVNVNGGAIALGHPIGASGARVLVTLLYALEQRGLKRGLASLCLGGGNAVAMVVERSLTGWTMVHWLTLSGKVVFRLLVWALLCAMGFSLLFGVFGVIVFIAEKNPNEGWQITAFGAYLGAWWGIGEGIKSFFGVADDPAPTGKELAQGAGKQVAGNLVPALNFVFILGESIAWSRRARLVQDGGKRAFLEAIQCSLVAIGMVVLVFTVPALNLGESAIWLSLLIVPAAAVFGAIRGSYTTAKTNHREADNDPNERNPWA